MKTLLLSLCLLLSSTNLFAKDCEINKDIVTTLKNCVSGIEVEAIAGPGWDKNRSYYRIGFEQPIDHENPALGTFRQKIVLAHRGYTEPMTLQTSGYMIFQVVPTWIAHKFDTNQIQVEHRFFLDSSPKIKDWTKLNILQSAKDFHAITIAFKKMYPKAWINTGASKGGMTSIYHKRFFPKDLDGTLADVAPLSFSNWDDRYIHFVETAGGEKYRECREKISQLQRHLLENRKIFQANISGIFQHLGSLDTAFEHAVQEMPFFFWQYNNPEDPSNGCTKIPSPKSSTPEVLAWFNVINPIDKNYGDKDLQEFFPYYYQAATELGSPALKRTHLQDLLMHPFNIDQYAPKGLQYQYTNSAMLDVEKWLETSADRMMLTYGEFDPWTAGMFTKQCQNDCHWNIAPGENHRSSIFYLKGESQQKALETVSRWFDKKPITDSLTPHLTLEHYEHHQKRTHHIP